MLGGSSSINAMFYIRGNPSDYDTWEKMGNPGWNWNSALEYFKKSEDNSDPKYVEDRKYHATGGLQKVGDLGAPDVYKDVIMEGYKELGLKKIKISNAN